MAPCSSDSLCSSDSEEATPEVDTPRQQRRHPVTNISRLAFSDTKMEAAFVAYLGKGSLIPALVRRGLLLMAWVTAVLKWMVMIASNHPRSPRAAFLWASGGAVSIGAMYAEGYAIYQLRRERRFVMHELIKSRNSVVMMVIRMVATVLFVRAFPVSSPQVRAYMGAGGVVFDQIRMAQAAPLLLINLLCFALTQLAHFKAGVEAATIWKEAAVVVPLAFLLPLLLLGILEARARRRFLSLHTHLPESQRQLPPAWVQMLKVFRWRQPQPAEPQPPDAAAPLPADLAAAEQHQRQE